jgi:alkanesulfonate monooxygenase SsuD/methylene tetrahydromethanopterin reductase-like flavin-dependent oxidoreductase (luciferase family)
LVARHADGWNTVWAWDPSRYEDRARALDRICEGEGRDPASVRRSVGLYAVVGEDERDVEARIRAYQERIPGGSPDGDSLEAWRRDRLAGTADEALERLSRFADLGVEEVILTVGAVPFALHDEEMVELIAERVLPEASKL